MIHTIKLQDNELRTLLEIVKADIRDMIDMQEKVAVEDDIDLLKAVARSFNDETARQRLDVIISGYEQDLKYI